MTSVTLKYVRPSGLNAAQWATLAGKVKPTAQRVTPVDTGRLQSSWFQVGQTSRSVTVKTDPQIAPYAAYVNDGTPRMAPRNYVQTARSTLNLLAGRILKGD